MSASAGGLFRSMGKASKAVAVRDDLTGEITRADALPREKHDFYPTPPEPTLALMSAEAAHLERLGINRVWEPACGDGAMMRDLESCGLEVVGSDLIDRGCGAVLADYFGFGHNSRLADAVITNPPFDKVNWRDGKGRWISHAMEGLGLRYMALLLNWNWPGAGGLAGIWGAYPPARCYLMRWKIDFTGQGQPPMLNGWFVWDVTHEGPPNLLMLDRADPTQGDMFSPDQTVVGWDLADRQKTAGVA